MLIEALRKQWEARSSHAPLHCVMTFEGGNLVLGAGTKLAAAEQVSFPEQGYAFATNDARIVALLSAAYRRPIAQSALAYINRALAKQRDGEVALALVHLALAGLPKLANPKEDARRLFIVDALMKEGVAPRIILEALELHPPPLCDLERRYNPDQPRVPAGNGRESGQWTRESAAGSTTAGRYAGSSRQYAQSFESDAERLPTDSEKESEPVVFYNPVTGQTISFPANSALEPRAPPGFVDLNDLPQGETYLSAPADADSPEPDQTTQVPVADRGAARSRAAAGQLATNRAAGAAWEESVESDLSQGEDNLASQVTLRTASGLRYRIDFLTQNPSTGQYEGIEAKASETARLSPNQSAAIPQIAQSGAVIVGSGKPGFPGGARLSPFPVRIVRPPAGKAMSIDKRGVIDFVLPNDKDGNASLIISDHLRWDVDSEEHLYLFQEKLNDYLQYALGGQLVKDFPEAEGRKIIIVIAAKYPLNEGAREFIHKCKCAVREQGIGLRYHQYVPGANHAY